MKMTEKIIDVSEEGLCRCKQCSDDTLELRKIILRSGAESLFVYQCISIGCGMTFVLSGEGKVF